MPTLQVPWPVGTPHPIEHRWWSDDERRGWRWRLGFALSPKVVSPPIAICLACWDMYDRSLWHCFSWLMMLWENGMSTTLDFFCTSIASERWSIWITRVYQAENRGLRCGRTLVLTVSHVGFMLHMYSKSSTPPPILLGFKVHPDMLGADKSVWEWGQSDKLILVNSTVCGMHHDCLSSWNDR